MSKLAGIVYFCMAVETTWLLNAQTTSPKGAMGEFGLT